MPASSNLAGVFNDALAEHTAIIRRLAAQQNAFQRVAALLCDCLRRGNKVIWCGNGGSAAEAQHLAAELIGRFCRPRAPLPSIALTTDTSVLTAIANDFGFEHVFERQIDALCQPGDVVIGISTSGNSANVCGALRRAHQLDAVTIAMSGTCDGRITDLADICLHVPSTNPARVQEAHQLLGHILCECIDRALAAEEQFENVGALDDLA
jgi:D-sedoheptulose 7-phosphate isomerase